MPPRRVDDCFTVHENLEFSVAAPNHFYLGRKLATQTRRHTGGVESRYLIRAIAKWRSVPCSYLIKIRLASAKAETIMPRQRNLWVTDTVEWFRETRARVPAAMMRASALFPSQLHFEPV